MLDKELFKLLGNNKKYIVYTVLLMIIGTFANLAVTAGICWAVSIAIEMYNGVGEAMSFIYPGIMAGVAIIVRYICSRLNGEISDVLGRRVKKSLREQTYDKILTMGVKSTDEFNIAGLTQISIEGIEALDTYFSSYLPQFFYAMFAPIILFGLCFNLSWKVSVVLIACVPIIPISIVLVSKWAKKIFAKYWGIYISMGDGFLDSIQGLKELKIFRADKKRNEVIDQKAEDFRIVTMKVLVMQLVSIGIMDLVAFAGAGVGTGFAIAEIQNGLSIPYALFLILVAVEFFLPLKALGSAFHVAMNGASAGKKILKFLSLPDPKWGVKEISSNKLSLNEVTFSYDGKRDVLKNVDMVFPAHGFTAIVGESGCGKSTVVNMLLGAIRPDKGIVKAGDDCIEDISRQSYYSHIASVSYNTYIFNESVKDNFRMAKRDVTDSEITEALKKVNLEEFIVENGGLDKIITEDANNISGGQKQRLALAVNLVADKDIYIFDEATSNIDIESEAIIMDNVREMSKTKNVIVISHRLQNVVVADNIYYMKNGVVEESGNHQSLMDNKKGYAELYTKQKQLEEGYKTYLEEQEDLK